MISQALSHQGIGKYIEYLQKQIQRCSHYENLNHIAEGKFLLEELKLRRELARNLYECIDVTSDKATVQLAALQNCEREATEWITRITGFSTQRELLQSELTNLMEMAEQRKKQENESQFIPASKRNKHE